MILFLTVYRYIKESKVLFFESVADVLNLLMNDKGYIRYQQLSRAEVFIIGPLTFVGFIFVNGILSNLQSYLTRPVLQPQNRTFEDIHSSSLPILVADYGRLASLLQDLTLNRMKHEDWKDKINVVGWTQYDDAFDVFNTSVSFYEVSVNFDFRFRVQKRLNGFNVNGFYNPKLQILKTFFSYLLREEFLFTDLLICLRMDSQLYFIYFGISLELVSSKFRGSREFQEFFVQN